MSSALARLTRSMTHHWKRGLLASLAVLVLLGVIGATGSSPADDFGAPGTESQKAIDLFRDHTPALAGGDATVVFTVKSGRITDPDARTAVKGAIAKIRAIPNVAVVSDPFTSGNSGIADAERLAVVDVRYAIEAQEIEKSDGKKLEEAARTAERNGVSVAMRGIVIDVASEQSAPVGELIGIAIAILLLTLLFRSKAAMATTLLGALVGVIAGQMLLTALASPLGLPDFAKTLAVMLGLGAGIDYSLLMIARFREQLAAGDSPRDASGKAGATAGATVVAAGLIVMVSIAGLLVIGIPILGKMGLGAAFGVAAVVVSALTILPALMGAFARRLKPKDVAHTEPSAAFGRWGEIITRRPWLSIAGGVVVLLILASPMLDMRLGQPDDGNQPQGKTQRIAYDQLTAAFGAGSNGPFLLAVDTPEGAKASKTDLAKLADAVRQTPGIEKVDPAAPSQDNKMATIVATPTTAPQDERTNDLLNRLRDDVIPQAIEGTSLKAYVGGNTASLQDFSDVVSSRLPVFIAIVIGLSVLLLMAAFRSLLIPIVSAVFNLLSILAAYGMVTAVFQDGIGASLIGADSGVPVVSFMPVMLFAILFGLSMDYNVFLLSRMHEAYNSGDDPRTSVVHGMAWIGKVVLFAGLIMSAVFLGFVTTDDVISKMFGVGLGLAILIDVLIVRFVISPAVVYLLGNRAWWLPAWLDRLLPNISLEGHLKDDTR